MASPPAPPERIVNALSIDVEDWFQVGAFEHVIDRADWSRLEHRFVANTERALALFERCGVQATFFTLGWVAERAGTLMRQIVEAGHELASHGYDHARVHSLTRQQFREDLAKTRAILEDAGGAAVTGYRAPSFSIDQRTPWAHAELAEAGYAYSSSVAPIAHDHYGLPDAPRFAWRPVADAPLIELPPSTMSVFGKQVLLGGGFFRALPYRMSIAGVRAANAAGEPAVTYFHPWELDPDQPRVRAAPLRSRLRHYAMLSSMEGKLERLCRDAAWGRTDDVIRSRARRLMEAS